jgi:hypothetical protein
MLLKLRKVDGVPQRTKDRAQVIRLSLMGWKVKKIVAYFHWRETTVRTALHRWIAHGLEGLWDKKRTGRKRTWQPEDIEYLEPQPGFSATVAKKKRIIWKRSRQSHKSKQDPKLRQAGQGDLDMLQLAAAAGEICLKYLDESGFCMWSPVSYTWAKQGVQKRMEQTQRRGRMIKHLGIDAAKT